MDGSSVVLHTRFNNVVFPAFALPITRMRKRLYLARSLAASSGSIVTAGAGAAGGTGAAGSSEIGEDEAGGGEEAGGGTVTGGGKRTGGGAVRTCGATTVVWLSGILRDSSSMVFFSRLEVPFDSLIVCWRSSAISMRVGDKSKRSGLCRPRTEETIT